MGEVYRGERERVEEGDEAAVGLLVDEELLAERHVEFAINDMVILVLCPTAALSLDSSG